MIAYCAADEKYFELYFDLWADQMNKYYPEFEKRIAVYEPSERIRNRCREKNIICVNAMLEEHKQKDRTEIFNKFYLLRWRNLPMVDDLVLETQINCLPVRTQHFPKDNNGVEQYRISRPKRGTLGGVSAAVFTPTACKKVVAVSKVMLYYPPNNDHPMNMWQLENLSHQLIKAEHQIHNFDKEKIPEYTYWITARTANKWTHQQKVEVLRNNL